MNRRSCAWLAVLTLWAGCTEEIEVEEPCLTDPDVSCCDVHPDWPECAPAPTCDDDPTLPFCSFPCEIDPYQAGCHVDCAEDPLGATCVPPAAGPNAPVEVIRDSLGIPHVFADGDEDAFWAAGYMQAVDRLGQMDMVRREALGRQAEVFGEGKVDRDILLRTIGIAGLTEVAVDRARTERPEDHALLVAWTRGVNARIQEILEGEAPLPPSMEELGYMPEPWAVMDGAAAGKLLLFGSSNQIENDILATVIRDYLPDVWTGVPLAMPLFDAYTVPESERPSTAGYRPSVPSSAVPARELPPDFAARFERFQRTVGSVDLEGSNNWAVHGDHTFNERPLIAGDPHQGLRAPSRFYAQHVSSGDGGRFHVAGWAFVGAPGIILGHNDRVAWTATLNYPDMMDMWDVTVSADESTMSLGGEDVPLRRRVEEIRVAGEAEPREVGVLYAPGRGVILPDGLAPVMIGRVGTRLLFDWTGFTTTDDIGAVVGLNTAGSVDEFEAAADQFGIGAFNWVAADANDITYISSQWVPFRTFVDDERRPYALLDGRDPETLWTGELFDRSMLPRSRGAGRGYVGSANNDPLGFTADGDLTNDAFYYGAFFDPGSRAQRAYDELERMIADTANPITVEDMQALQTDTRSLFADRLMPIFEDAWSRLPTDDALAAYRDRPELTELHDILSAWDHRMERGEVGPVVFTGLLYFFAKAAVEDELSLAFQSVLDASSTYILKFPILAAEGAWPNSEDLFQDGVPATMLEALDLTHLWLTNVLGVTDPSTYTWGELHCTSFGPREGIDAWSGVGCVPTDGGEGTLNVSTANLLSSSGARDAHRSGGGPIFRMVASFDDDGTPVATINFPPGNVEDPSSPYWDNALDDWAEDRYRRLLFRRMEVEDDAQETITLTP